MISGLSIARFTKKVAVLLFFMIKFLKLKMALQDFFLSSLDSALCKACMI